MESFYENLLQRSNTVGHRVITEIACMDQSILNRKESDKRWSVLEVVQHLNKVYDIYLPKFERVIEESSSLNGEVQKKEKSIMGRLALFSTKPKGKNRRFKMKTFDFFEPEKLMDSHVIIEDFERNKESFNELIRKARIKNLNGRKMSTSLEKLRLFVPESFEFVMSHEERHLIQIEETLERMM